MSAHNRMTLLFDEGSFAQMGASGAAVVTGYGSVFGQTVFAFSQDREVNSGAVGAREGALICKMYEMAAAMGAPIVGIYDSDGLDLQSPFDALGAYGDMLRLSNNLSGVVPQISVVCGTCGGTAAMIAAGADFTVMTKQAELFSAPPFTTGDKDGAKAEKMLQKGAVHIVADDDEAAMASVRDLLALLPANNLAPLPMNEYGYDEGKLAALQAGAAPADIIAALCDDDTLCSLHGGFGAGATVALGSLGGMSCGFVGAGPGALDRNDCAKIGRFVSLCDSLNLPLVTLVDTEGFSAASCGRMIRATASLSHAYAEATAPKVAVLTGQAIGSAYIALAGKNAGCDVAFAWPSAVVSALDPQAAVTLLKADELAKGDSRDALVAAYKANDASASAAVAAGAVDSVVDPAATRDKLIATLDMLSSKRVSSLPKKHSNTAL